MLRIFNVLATIVAAYVPCDELILVINAYAVDVSFDAHAGVRVFGWHAVCVSVERDAELAGGTYGEAARAIVGQCRKRLQMRTLLLEQIARPLMGFTVDAHIGDGVEPEACGGVDRAKVAELEPVEEVLFDVANGVFHAPFFMRLPHVASGNVKAVVAREIQIPRIEHRRFAGETLEHRRAQIIDDEALGAAVKCRKRMLVAGKEVLHGLRDGELQIHQPAVTQHHHEEGQPPARRAHRNRTVFAPVDLGGFAKSKVKFQIRLTLTWADFAHVIANRGRPAAVARLAYTLEDLLRAVGMAIEPTHNQSLEWIKTAGTLHRAPPLVARALHPFRHRFRVQPERACSLRDGEPLPLMMIMNLHERFVIDHRLSIERARSHTDANMRGCRWAARQAAAEHVLPQFYQAARGSRNVIL